MWYTVWQLSKGKRHLDNLLISMSSTKFSWLIHTIQILRSLLDVIYMSVKSRLNSFASRLVPCKSIPILSFSLACGMHAWELGTMMQNSLSMEQLPLILKFAQWGLLWRCCKGITYGSAFLVTCTGNDWDRCCICISPGEFCQLLVIASLHCCHVNGLWSHTLIFVTSMHYCNLTTWWSAVCYSACSHCIWSMSLIPGISLYLSHMDTVAMGSFRDCHRKVHSLYAITPTCTGRFVVFWGIKYIML